MFVPEVKLLAVLTSFFLITSCGKALLYSEVLTGEIPGNAASIPENSDAVSQESSPPADVSEPECDPSIYLETNRIAFSRGTAELPDRCMDFAIVQTLTYSPEGKLVVDPEGAIEECSDVIEGVPETGESLGQRCGDIPSGSSVTQLRYQKEQVPSGDTCISEAQTVRCEDGTLIPPHSEAGYTFESCKIDDPLACGSVANGDQESRMMFREPQVESIENCVSETQVRTCTDGVFSEWSGDFQFTSCEKSLNLVGNKPSPEVPMPEEVARSEPATLTLTCDGNANGFVETEVSYTSSSVPFGSTCSQTTRERTCSNGTWTNWSVGQLFSTCTVGAAASCGTKPHGSVESRLMYFASSVPHNSWCASESQSRTCQNGSWSPWTGSYQHTSCQVSAPPPPSPCVSSTGAVIPSGQTESRTMYLSSSVPYGSVCSSQTQRRTCNNGSWGSWSGSYSSSSCVVQERPPSGGCYCTEYHCYVGDVYMGYGCGGGGNGCKSTWYCTGDGHPTLGCLRGTGVNKYNSEGQIIGMDCR